MHNLAESTQAGSGTPYKSRTVQTYAILRDAIVEAKFLPGERLRIENLCRTLGASTGAVREALSRLTAEGLVKAEPQKGFVVAPISRRNLIELTEVRVSIETHCLDQAIQHGDVEWEAVVMAARHRLNALSDVRLQSDSEQVAKWHERHMQFHQALVSACPNECWLQLRAMLFIKSERYRRLSGPVEEGNRSIEAEHNEIADAALARNAKAACEAMERHLNETTRILLKSQILFS